MPVGRAAGGVPVGLLRTFAAGKVACEPPPPQALAATVKTAKNTRINLLLEKSALFTASLSRVDFLRPKEDGNVFDRVVSCRRVSVPNLARTRG